jgi:hypothetical protein
MMLWELLKIMDTSVIDDVPLHGSTECIQGQEWKGTCSHGHLKDDPRELGRARSSRKCQPGTWRPWDLHNFLVMTEELSQKSTQKSSGDYTFAKHLV